MSPLSWHRVCHLSSYTFVRYSHIYIGLGALLAIVGLVLVFLEEAVDVGVVVVVTVLVGHHGDVIVIMPVPIPTSTPPKTSREGNIG